MLYIVTGLPRTGTSMMMRCLDTTMNVYRDTNFEAKVEKNAHKTKTYNPNPNGYFAMRLMGKEIESFDGKVIKPQIYELPGDIKVPYKMILMKREEAARSSSYKKAFNLTVPAPWYLEQENIENYFKPLVVNYEDVIANPTKEFQRILDAGWPIDINACVKLVDSKLKRFF